MAYAVVKDEWSGSVGRFYAQPGCCDVLFYKDNRFPTSRECCCFDRTIPAYEDGRANVCPDCFPFQAYSLIVLKDEETKEERAKRNYFKAWIKQQNLNERDDEDPEAKRRFTAPKPLAP